MEALENKLKYILEDTIEIKTQGGGSYYKKLGYIFKRNKNGSLVYNVKVKDLRKNCVKEVSVRCSKCNKIRKIGFKYYLEAKTTYCNKCSIKIVGQNRKTNNIGLVLKGSKILEYTSKTKDKKWKINVKCACGVIFETVEASFISRGGVVCKKCGYKLVSKAMKERHRNAGNWVKDDHSDKENVEKYKHRYSEDTESKKSRTARIIKDKRKCCICGEIKRDINVHHLNSWRDFHESRYLLTNLITLCTDCHKKFHKEYGSGNNTVVDFYNFLTLIARN